MPRIEVIPLLTDTRCPSPRGRGPFRLFRLLGVCQYPWLAAVVQLCASKIRPPTMHMLSQGILGEPNTRTAMAMGYCESWIFPCPTIWPIDESAVFSNTFHP